MKRKVVFIVLSVLLMIFGISYMAVIQYNSNQKSFKKSGYILDNKSTSSSNKSNVYYFDEDTSYKSRYDSNVVFTDTNGDKVDVVEASFIHYNDDSIGTLKKAVIFNLEEINSEIPKYYNIFQGSILEYSGGTYTVDNLGKPLKFKRFIEKVSDTKFLIVGDDLKINLDGSHEIEITSKYIELNFVDEKVVTIENKDVKYQTIGKDANIVLGDKLTLNLDNRYIFYENEPKLSIDQMIIDSSDNIEIQPIEEVKEEEDEENPNASEENGSNGESESGNGGEEEEGGSAGGNIGENVTESEVVESELVLPTADISELEITANKIEGTIRITDKDSLITGGATTTIIENSTGRVVDYIETSEGNYNIELSSSKLMPDTVYNLVTTLSYKKNDIIYTTDIVQNVFSTSSLGVSLEKDYYTADSLNFNVLFDEYSKVRNCNVNLYNTMGELLETIPVEKTNNLIPVSFTNLKSNTKYSVVIDNILYDDYIVSNDYSIEVGAKTLKTRPIIGTPSFAIDKKNGKFTLKLDNMVDSENGVESYRYAVYDTRTMDAGKGDPITVFEKGNASSIDLSVDDILIFREVPYVFQVVIEFYDNEKYIEYYTSFSDNMQLDGREAPSISWKSNTVTFESIDGTISIVDTGNTIDLDKPMTIVYTNSIGTTEQYTTAGNTIIPFTKNNLRANETYTISVYGTVNLQDGNPPIDNYHIGSVTVNTKPTNPFNVSFSIDAEDVSSTFKVTARLLNVATADNRLEASTLTGISFVLHEGNSINGKVIKTVRNVDRDLREYYSDLQTSYYDQTFIINPGFFGFNNSDLKSEYYTIEIKDAYDYTTFKNEIGILNNFVTVKANDYLPDMPGDPTDSITYELIRNKDAEEYDSNLQPTTIVGMKIKASYPNEKKNAVTLRYHIFDANDCVTDEETSKKTCKEITSIDYTVPADGAINDVSIPVGYGTDHSLIDTEIVRGHSYYATFEAFLDRNGDGTVDTKVPSGDTEYRSKNINVGKQYPLVTMYPSSSNDDSITVKYTYSDVDKAIIDGEFHAITDLENPFFNSVSSVSVSNTNGTEESATFSGLTPGMFEIAGYMGIYKNSGISLSTYIKQAFHKGYKLPRLTYHLELDTNRLVVTFDDYQNKIADYNRIAALNFTFTATNESGTTSTITKNFVKIVDGSAIVDLFDLSDFIGQNIQLKIDALYDTDYMGYDISSDYYAVQNIENELGGGEYYTISSQGSLFYDTNIPVESVFKMTKNANAYTFKSMISGKSFKVNHKPDAGGMVYNYSHLVPKKLASVSLQPASTEYNTFKFTKIVPGISVMNTIGESRIVPLMTSVSIGASIYGIENGLIDIRDSKIYIHVYKTDGENLEEVGVKETTVEELKTSVTIDNLYPDTGYALRMFAFIKGEDGNYTEQQMYDIDENNPARTYYFNTLSGVRFSNFTYEYSAKRYDKKTLTFFYSMNRTIGFDKVRYVFTQRLLDPITGQYYYEPVENLSLPDDTGLENNMKLQFSIAPGETGLVFGNSYRLEVKPIASITIDGVTQEIELSNIGGTYDFTLNTLKKPYIGVRGTYTPDYTNDRNVIDFTTTVYDSNRVIVGDKYTIQLLNDQGQDITPAAYVGYEASSRTYRIVYRAPDLEVGHVYKFLVKYTVDMKNDIVSAEDRVYSYEINLLSSDEINVGNISAVANLIYTNRIDLQFSYSYRLTSINKLNYSIYNSASGAVMDGSIDFNPQQIKVDGQSLYIQPLPNTLPSPGLYYIQTQFIADGRVVYDGGVDYTYIAE